MGAVTFIDRQTGQTVLAEFPLHPGLVGFTKGDGTQAQLFRQEFDQIYRQQLPELPQVNTAPLAVAGANDVAIAVDLKTHIAPEGNKEFILGHEAWFSKIWDEIKNLRSKVDELLDAHPALKASIERVELAMAHNHPTLQALERAVVELTADKKPADEDTTPPTGA